MYLMHKSNHLTRWLCASRGCLRLHPPIACRRLLWINFIVQFWVLGPLLHGFQDVHAASPTSESHYMGLIGECFNCHNAPALKTRDGLDSTWVKQPMFEDWAKHDLHAIASRALENEHGLQVLQRLGNTKEMRQRCLACHATPIKGTAFPVADIQEVEFDVQHGVSCEACHGPYEKWETIHRSSLWRKMPLKEKQEYSGFVEMRDPLIRAERCASCHVGSLEEQKFITHAMYVAGHPPLFGYEMQGYLESMPKHWLPIREKPAAIQQEQEDAGLWQKDTLSGGQASFVGQAVSLRVALETLADVAEKSMHDESGFAWPELGLMDCASCHHDLRDKSWRRDPVRVAQVGDRGSNRLPAPGRPGLPTWSRVALIDPGLVDVWNSADKAGDVAAAVEQLQKALAELDAEFRAHPFGNPDVVKKRARDAAHRADTLARELEKLPLMKSTGEQLSGALVQIGRERLLPYDDARQIAWVVAQLHRDLQSVTGQTPGNQDRQDRDRFHSRIALTVPNALQRELPPEDDYDWRKLNSLLNMSIDARNRYENDGDFGPHAVQQTWRDLFGAGN